MDWIRSRSVLLLEVGAILLCGLMCRTSHAQQKPAPATSDLFDQKVRPLLEKNCLGCHGVGARLSGLDLRTRESALRGGTRGAAFKPGSAADSLLYKLVTGAHTPQMPPTSKLKPAEIEVLKQWLDGGAHWSADPITSAAKQTWWSFRLPQLPAVPYPSDSIAHPLANPVLKPMQKAAKVTSSKEAGKQTSALRAANWIKNPIDAFVMEKMHSSGMTPSPPASRRALIRRGYMDLIGLPPTPEDVEAFVNDRAPDAWEKVVDRLLVSPRYGERWGRHWLDLVRYADSGGFEGDKDRLLAWRYRDYVIDAFNADEPYDRFVREQIAGDELTHPTRESLIATGYLACGPLDIVMQNEKNRADELDDLVATTGTVFLGLTVGCARCHDHKYDPIKQTDYYRLSAIFAPSERREMDIPTDAERKSIEVQNNVIEQSLAPLRKRLEPLRQAGVQSAKAKGQAQPTEEQIVQRQVIRPKQASPQAQPTEEQIVAALTDVPRKEYTDLQAQIKALEGKRVALPKAMAVTDRSRTFPASHLLVRGDPYHPGEEVEPGFIVSLPGGDAVVSEAQARTSTTGRRAALAEWIVSAENPLTARVWVNRVWRQHFGHGLVDTPSNFGVSGELPSHPELLDWLAVKFKESGWRTKPLHRMILLSSTYQQASDIRPECERVDPLDRMLWRMPVRRLEGEAIRDSLLDVCGSLNLRMDGPPVYPPVDPSLRADTFQGPNWQDGEDGPSTWRRSVYVKVKRSLLLPELEVFDCPEISTSVAQRNISTTPTQALTLLNDPFVLRQAGLFAKRLEAEEGTDARKQIDRAFRLAFARPPNSTEMGRCLDFLKRRGAGAGPTPLADLCHAILNLNEFVYVP